MCEMYNFLLTTRNPHTQNNSSKYLFTKVNLNVTAWKSISVNNRLFEQSSSPHLQRLSKYLMSYWGHFDEQYNIQRQIVPIKPLRSKETVKKICTNVKLNLLILAKK